MGTRRAVHLRFAAWYEWKAFPSQAAAAKFIGCKASAVSQLLAGDRDAGLLTGVQIEEATKGWPDGPILAREWLHGVVLPASDTAPEAARRGAA